MNPRRGEVYWVAFDPSVGGEIQKTRPAVIISNDEANRALNRVVVIPLTSQTRRVTEGEALIDVNGRPHKALASQLTTSSKLRIGSRIGIISPTHMEAVESIIIEHLGL